MALFAYQYIPANLLIGFLFLNEASTSDSKSIDIRLGYLLSQENWGKGLGSELIKGLVEWGEEMGNVSSISGGVEVDNKASIRVLEKNGFSILQKEDPSEGMLFLERKFKLTGER
ncbi:MAG: ribosomal-protein-alanine N-acetyltransferase [Candidatus Latescibacterota bacterium]